MRSRAIATVTDVVVGPGRPQAALEAFVRDARGRLLMDIHTFSASRPQLAMIEAIRDGARPSLVLSKREDFAGTWLAKYVADGRLGVRAYSPDGSAYQHSKLAARTASKDGPGASALFTDVSPCWGSEGRHDVALMLADDTAQAAVDVIAATFAGNLPRLGASVEDAARAGLLFDEPLVGVRQLSPTMLDLANGADRRVIHISKGIDDLEFSMALVNAQGRGANVVAVERDIARESGRLLQAAEVPTALQPVDPNGSRLNILIADDVALVSTSYPWAPMLGKGAAVQSRESGVLIAGDALASLEEQLAHLPEGRAARQLAGLEPMKRRWYAPWRTPNQAAEGVERLQERRFMALPDALRGNRLVERLR